MKIRVKVFPNTKKEEFKQIGENRFECFVRARPRNNEANERVLEMVRAYFVDARGVRIIRGNTTQNKTVEIFGPQENLI